MFKLWCKNANTYDGIMIPRQELIDHKLLNEFYFQIISIYYPVTDKQSMSRCMLGSLSVSLELFFNIYHQRWVFSGNLF